MTTFYSFDSSAFINGWRDLLPPEIFGGLWRRIEECIDSALIRSVDEVQRELSRHDDDVAQWAARQSGLFLPIEEDIQVTTGMILKDHPRLVGVGGKRNQADPFVIALAQARGGVVVTEETASGRLDKPRIPDVCHEVGVPCLTLIGFVRQMGWSW